MKAVQAAWWEKLGLSDECDRLAMMALAFPRKKA